MASTRSTVANSAHHGDSPRALAARPAHTDMRRSPPDRLPRRVRRDASDDSNPLFSSWREAPAPRLGGPQMEGSPRSPPLPKTGFGPGRGRAALDEQLGLCLVRCSSEWRLALWRPPRGGERSGEHYTPQLGRGPGEGLGPRGEGALGGSPPSTVARPEAKDAPACGRPAAELAPVDEAAVVGTGWFRHSPLHLGVQVLGDLPAGLEKRPGHCG
jgi:hypothetical protein